MRHGLRRAAFAPGRSLVMCTTCKYVLHMSRMVQVRNLPEAMHRKLKARAATAGLSLSDYIRLELERSVERPTREELLERLSRSEPVNLRPSAAKLVRAERDAR